MILLAIAGQGRFYTIELGSLGSPSGSTGADSWVQGDAVTLPKVRWGGSWDPPPPRPRPGILPCPLCDQLGLSDIAYNRPDRLRYGAAAPIELVLAPRGSGADAAAALAQDLPGNAETRAGVPYALRMRARLSGPDFAIDPVEPQDRTVLPNQATRWSWTVRPTAFGADRLLTLELSAILDGKDGPTPDAAPVVFREYIPVDIGPWDRAQLLAAGLTPVQAAIAGAGAALLGALGALGAFWRWWRPQKQQPPEYHVLVGKLPDDPPPPGA
ncbi:MAG: hypothetical protein U1E34_00590 [Amaricoccus sp.]